MKINKYKLYFLLLGLLLACTYGKQLWYTLTYKKTSGIIREYIMKKNKGRRARVSYYPIVDFKTGDSLYAFYGSANLHDTYYDGSTVPVIYNPQNPNEAFVYTFLGFWGNSFLIVFPLFVVISMFLLPVGALPKILVINKNSIKNKFR